ncbi:MAG: hypothetical protein WC998_03455 [Candidatus Paceibacterota bacterium]|jgi:hypothetical protein
MSCPKCGGKNISGEVETEMHLEGPVVTSGISYTCEDCKHEFNVKELKPLTEQEKAEQLKKQRYYDPWAEFDCPADGCDGCYKSGCPQRQEQEDLCDFTGEECIDSDCRHMCGCVGCEMLAPPPKEELEEENIPCVETIKGGKSE